MNFKDPTRSLAASWEFSHHPNNSANGPGERTVLGLNSLAKTNSRGKPGPRETHIAMENGPVSSMFHHKL